MRIAVSLLLALTAIGCCRLRCEPRALRPAAEETVRLFPVNPQGKWGYIDASGAIVIEPQFDTASFFNGQRAVVGFGGTSLRDGTWAFVDAHGATTPATRKEVEAFFATPEDKWWCRYGPSPEDPRPFEGANGLWGLRRGPRVVLAPTYYDISPLGGGLAHAHRDAEYIYLDEAGQVVWEPTYAVHLTDADWLFDADQSDLEDAVAANPGPYTFKMVSKDMLFETGGTLEVWRAERRVATIPCQATFKTVFIIREGTLYYADPAGYTTGCVAGAVRLEDGKHLWRTKLKALWPYGINHSLYRNEANVRMREGLMIVSASENSGEWVEALDAATGRIVGRNMVNDRTSP